MLYRYLIENFEKGEPIFLSDIPTYSKYYVRQEMKRLTDDGKIERVSNGVYYVPYKTILGLDGMVSIDLFLKKKYLEYEGKISGFYCGLQLANMFGITSQNSSVYEIISNNSSTNQRKIEFAGWEIIVYKPVVCITEENVNELQFLDLMLNIDRYSELNEEELKNKIKKIINAKNINLSLVKKYLPLYPDRIYKNLYTGGILDVMV